MKIILSPAKKMRVDTDAMAAASTPVYLEQAEEILARVASAVCRDFADLVEMQ